MNDTSLPSGFKLTLEYDIKFRIFHSDLGHQSGHEDVSKVLSQFFPAIDANVIVGIAKGMIADALLHGKTSKVLFHMDEHGVKVNFLLEKV